MSQKSSTRFSKHLPFQCGTASQFLGYLREGELISGWCASSGGENRLRKMRVYVGPSTAFRQRSSCQFSELNPCAVGRRVQVICARGNAFCRTLSGLRRNLARANDEPLGSWSDIIEGKTGNEGQSWLSSARHDFGVFGANDSGELDTVNIVVVFSGELDEVIFLDISKAAKKCVAVSGDDQISRTAGQRAAGNEAGSTAQMARVISILNDDGKPEPSDFQTADRRIRSFNRCAGAFGGGAFQSRIGPKTLRLGRLVNAPVCPHVRVASDQ